MGEYGSVISVKLDSTEMSMNSASYSSLHHSYVVRSTLKQ